MLGRVLDRATEDKDVLDAARNPYFKSVVEGVRHANPEATVLGQREEGLPVDPERLDVCRVRQQRLRNGLVHDAPQEPVAAPSDAGGQCAEPVGRGCPPAHRRRLQRRSFGHLRPRHQHQTVLCLAPALDAYWELLHAYPDLLPPAKRADLEAGLKCLADYQLTDYGLARLAKRPDIKQPAYPNMDVHHVLIMEFAHRLWNDPQYAKERDAFVKILDSAVYPMGAWTYINTQNECFVYHHLNVLYSARFWKLTGNPITLAMLKRTIPFYPANVEPAGMPEYYTDACWKHYWGGGGAPAPDVIAGLFDDPLNKRVAEVCAAVWGYERGYQAAIAAEFWKPIPAKPLADNYVIYDTNVQGPRGRFGPWSFAGNGRNHGVGFQGKDTFAGCMITDAAARPLPLDSALQVVTTEVRMNHTDNHWRGGRCHSAQEKLTTTLGPDFGSLAVRYTVSQPTWRYTEDILFPWEGTQVWYMSKHRLLGLVALEATADETRAAVHGRIRLGLKRPLERLDATSWKYGRLHIKIHDHNYAKIVDKPSETFFLDKPEAYRSTEITLVDPLSTAAGEKGDMRFKKGTQYYFLVEAFPEGSPPSPEIKRIEAGSLAGFRLRESNRVVTVLHNPTPKAAEVNPALAGLQSKGRLAVYLTHQTDGKPSMDTLPTRLEPDTHVVIVTEEKGAGARAD